MAAYWRIAAHSAYDTFSWYKYLSVNPRFVEWNFFLIAPFPDHYLLVPFYTYVHPRLRYKGVFVTRTCFRNDKVSKNRKNYDMRRKDNTGHHIILTRIKSKVINSFQAM